MATAPQAFAAEVPTGIAITNWAIGGDGRTPTFLQYLDAHNRDIKSVANLGNTDSKGALQYSVNIAVPPAVLAPSLSLGYSSEAGLTVETALGWSLEGIAEVRRPLSPAFTLKDKADWNNAEWLVSGPGFSGTLQPSGNDDGRFFLHSAGPGYVSAVYDSGANSWTISRDTVTFTLIAVDGGTATNAGTAWWRVSQVQDSSGNVINYKYKSDGRLDYITYGGNVITGESALLRIDFSYSSNAAKRTSVRAGFLTEYKYHLTKITVNSLALGISSRAYAYVFSHTKTDSLNLLTTIKREGITSAVSETMAKFTYSTISTSSSPARTGSAPASLGTAESITTSEYGDTSSYTQKSLVDYNRDGLPDIVDASKVDDEGYWYVRPQSVDMTNTRPFSWTRSGPYVAEVDGNFQLNQTTTKYTTWQKSESPAYTTLDFNDMDGDGYQDIIYAYDKGEWSVCYGNSGHDYTSCEAESAPEDSEGHVDWSYLQGKVAVHANNATPPSEARELIYGLLDFNGDGWLDAYAPADGKVWLHTAERGSGWGKTPITFKMTHRFGAMRTVKYTYDSEYFKIDTENYCENECKSQCEDYAEEAISDCESSCNDNHGECVGDCENSDCDANCDEALGTCVEECGYDDYYNACYDGEGTDDGCFKSCQDSTKDTLQYYISTNNVMTDHSDINGDGLPDYIDASTTPWQVYLGTGSEFLDAMDWVAPVKYLRRTDEGHPAIKWKSSDLGDQETDGSPAMVVQTLIDVDGDGLLDLALGKSLGDIWYKNTGSGFETSSRALPAWWPDAFMTSVSYSEVDNDTHVSIGTTTTTEMMMDIDHDGMVDHVAESILLDTNTNGIVDGMTDYRASSGIKYGAYPKPHIITKIDNIQGGTTDIAYRSLATVSPSGDYSKKQYTPNVSTLVDTFSTKDTRSGQYGGTSFSYADGFYENGVFQGFKSRTTAETVNGAWSGKTEYAYTLDRDLPPVVKQKKLYVDANLSFGSSIKRGTSVSEKLRYQMDTSFVEKSGENGTFYLPQSRKTTEYGELTGTRTITEGFTWDDAANLLTYSHDGGGISDDVVKVAFTYLADADDAKAKFYRMTSKAVYGTDPLTAAYQNITMEKYYYDGDTSGKGPLTAGRLTRSEIWGGWLGGAQVLDAEKLSIDIEYGSRGEIIKATDNGTGISMNQTFGFGGAVLETQTNDLGQHIISTLDRLGRTTTIKDDNGLSIQSTYDDFSRLKQKVAIGKDGKSHVLEDYTYSNASAPYYTMARTYNDGATADTTSYEVEDGFGNAAQSWQQDKDGSYLVTRQTKDVRGLSVNTVHPASMKTFSTTAPLNMATYFGKTYYDALGTPREIIRDNAVPTGSQLMYFDNPGEQIHKDEKGYLTKTTSDAHGRITKVEQGQSSTYTTTAEYRYDPLGRLVSFKDANGVTYKYSYDGAGRLRQVSYRSNAANATSDKVWYTHDYKGELVTKITDDEGKYAAWEYDVIGRPIKLITTDSLPSSPGTLEYTWDYDDDWIGAVYKSIDPSGSTEYSYDELGNEDMAKRAYNASATGTTSAKFYYEHDLQGHITSTTFPSNHKVKSTYSYGYLSKQTATTLTATDYTLNYTYNKWGLWDSVTSSKGHKYAHTFTTPLWPDEFSLTYGTKAYKRGYTWDGNGLLNKRKLTTPSGSLSLVTAYDYAHDMLKQLSSIKKYGKTLEAYTYDPVGSGLLKTMTDSSGVTWTYNSPDKPNAIASRKSSTGKSETYKFTDAGRLEEWYSSSGTYKYYYDGLGRLRGVTLGGAWQMTFDYDANGTLVRKGDNNSNTSSPYYAYNFRNWRYDEKTKVRTQFDNDLVAAENGTRQWMLPEYDGHVTLTINDSGTVKSSRFLGGFGATVSSSGTEWPWNTLHGAEKQVNLFHMGQRHLMPTDGMWLQPEPMLYRGIPKDKLAMPLGLAPYRYAANSPMVLHDHTGFDPQTMQPYLPIINALNTGRYGLEPGTIIDAQNTYRAGVVDETIAITKHGLWHPTFGGLNWQGFADPNTFVQITNNGLELRYHVDEDGFVKFSMIGGKQAASAQATTQTNSPETAPTLSLEELQSGVDPHDPNTWMGLPTDLWPAPADYDEVSPHDPEELRKAAGVEQVGTWGNGESGNWLDGNGNWLNE